MFCSCRGAKPPSSPRPLSGVVAALLLLASGCGSEKATELYRLVDAFDKSRVEGRVAVDAARPPRTEWRFDGDPQPKLAPALRPTRGFAASASVSGLEVREGRLVGRTTGRVALLHVERKSGLDDPDPVHAVEVRARVSAGTRLSVATRPPGPFEMARAVVEAERGVPWTFSTPVLPGDRFETYTIPVTAPLSGRRVGHLLLWPTDAAGAEFAVESVRLVFRKEHITDLPSGVSWQGLGEVYQETLVLRAGESARFQTTIPERGILDVALGTHEDGPVTFLVTVSSGGAEPAHVLRHTTTSPHRWERRRVDLSSFSGRSADLALSVESARPGTIGFWGAPVVRGLRDPVTAAAPQGVILIQGDTLRLDHLDLFGYDRPTAPTLRRLAGEGVAFRNAVAQTGWTKASVSSVMTSLYPSTHGVHQIPDRLPASVETLAEAFRTAGYSTIAFSSVPFTGRLTNLHQGFEELHEAESLPERTGPHVSKTARPFVDRLVQWLDDRPDVPFFAYLHVFDPHSPYEPREPYATMWADPTRREAHLEELEKLKPVVEDPFLADRGMATTEEMTRAGIDPKVHLRTVVDWYDGSIRGMDDELARLVERLQEHGLGESTVMAIFADHGEELHDHGRMWHGHSVYGEMIRVPLIFWGPGISPQPIRDEAVQLLDVMPTLLELSRIPVPESVQGRSLGRLLAGPGAESWEPRPVFAEKQPMGADSYPSKTESYAIVDGSWKLVRHAVRPPGRTEFELFDFLRDPLDQTDLSARHPEIVELLANRLEDWHRAAVAARPKSESESTEGMTSEQLENLRSLGYVQ